MACARAKAALPRLCPRARLARPLTGPAGSEMAKAEEREKSRSVTPLRALWPFLRPYRGLLWAALAALTVDRGADAEPADRGPPRRRQLLRREPRARRRLLRSRALGIAALLAIGTAARFYLVTILGERVIADIRRGIYDRVDRPEPGVLRADHDRRGAVAPDHGHDARALGRSARRSRSRSATC